MTARMTAALAPLLLLIPAGAAARNDGAGTAAYQFLRLGSSARIEALGEAGTAQAVGVDALVWNPARLLSAPGTEVGASYATWLSDVEIGHAGAVWPLGRAMVGVSLKSLSLDDFGNVPGEAEVGQSDLAVGAAAAYPLAGGLHAGFGVKLVRSSLADFDATGWAGDLGLNYEWVEGWDLAAAVRNFGPAFGYVDGVDETLPTQAAVALGSRFGELRVDSEVLWEEGPGIVGVLGLEYRAWERLFLRVGSRLGEESGGAREPWAAGIGVEARPGLNLEYAFRDGKLEASHRLGVRWSPGRSLGPVARETALSPREYYVNVVNQALERSLVNFPLSEGDSLVVRPSAAHEAANVLSMTIADHLRGRGYAVEVADAEPEITEDLSEAAKLAMREAGVGVHPDVPLLQYEVLTSTYEILKARRARWVGPRSIDRAAEVDLDLTLTVKGEEAPRWTSSARGRESESVIASDVPRSGGYPRPGGTGPKAGKRHPLVEPAVVGGLVTGLAIIFFSNRNVGE